MQNMWISVVLIVLVIVIGLIAGARLSTPGPQRRAVFSAFGALSVLAIWFFVFIAFFPADWIVPFFTVACIVIPICIYMGVARGKHDKSMKIPKAKSVDTIKAAQPQGPKPPTPEQSAVKPAKQTTAPVAVSQPAKTQSPDTLRPISQPVRTAASTLQQSPSSKQAVAPSATTPKKTAETPKAKPDTKPEVQQKAAPTTTETKPATSDLSTRTSADKPIANDLEKDLVSHTGSPAPEAPDPKIAAAADMDILLNDAADKPSELEASTKSFERASQTDGPDLHVGSPLKEAESSSESVEATEPAAPSPTPQPAPTPKKEAKPKSTAEAFAEFNARASALRDQGAYAIAALLYEEAAAIAPNASASREAQFDELSCYVKAGDAKKAKSIAAKLRQSSVLTRFERIKLDAVERMG